VTLRHLVVRRAVWPLKGAFTISRGAKTTAETLIVEIVQGDARGRGECVPYARYGESLESAEAAILALRADIEAGLDRERLQTRLGPGAARNALDCALIDLDAKASGRRAWEVLGLAAPAPVTTAYTISLDAPERMAEAASREAWRPLIKLKLAGEGDLERVRAVHAAAPRAKLIVDANEGWTPAHLDHFPALLAEAGVVMIEQPLPAGDDGALEGYRGPLPISADESCHDRGSLDALAGRYAMVNIKLDKTGGLTEALALRDAALARGFRVMVGCMMASSLSMAPAVLVAQGAALVDLDGPLWLARDHEPAIRIEGSTVHPPGPELWG
jgi:L-Ala-D/L-Glu epimerase